MGSSNRIRTNVLPQKLGLFSRTTNTMLGLMQYPQGLGLFSHTTNMWQISNLQIDSSVRNSIDTTATITNTTLVLILIGRTLGTAYVYGTDQLKYTYVF